MIFLVTNRLCSRDLTRRAEKKFKSKRMVEFCSTRVKAKSNPARKKQQAPQQESDEKEILPSDVIPKGNIFQFSGVDYILVKEGIKSYTSVKSATIFDCVTLDHILIAYPHALWTKDRQETQSLKMSRLSYFVTDRQGSLRRVEEHVVAKLLFQAPSVLS